MFKSFELSTFKSRKRKPFSPTILGCQGGRMLPKGMPRLPAPPQITMFGPLPDSV
jgi:hypothetical protein